MKTKSIIAHIARTLLALTFIFSGFVKAIDPLGTVYKIEDYLKAFGGFFTDLMPLATFAAIGLIAFEFTLGVMMLCNIRTNWTAWLTLLFYCVMTPLTLFIALTNPVSDCGCFGDAVVLTNWQTFWKNIVLLSLVIILLCTKRALYQTFTNIAEFCITFVAIVFVLAWMEITYYHLPLIDFRPYKVGNNIPELMEYPDDAEPDQYEVNFIYEKDGVQKSFTLENYPKGDPDWHFVDQQSVLIKKGYEPPIHDFMLTNLDYDDLTDEILESETPVTCIVMYDLQKADKRLFSKVHALYNRCLDKDTPIYILTGAGAEEIADFARDNELPEEIFLNCDPVTLKTIVRANPGVFVIQDGTIIDKYNIRNKQF